MGIYNFQERFVPFIASGQKTHTIRAIRKYPDKPGNLLNLYTGLRRKGARLLARVRCVKVENIFIACDGNVRIDGVYLAGDEREAFARRDGFENFKQFTEFWNGTSGRVNLLPFRGHIIHWRNR